jgi:hypothetical protein
MPVFNTTGITQLNLSFKHMLDDYAAGATLRVQSSTNGSTWTNEAWSLATSSNSNVGPAVVNTTITSNLNSPTTYIAFTIEGDLYQYDYWYIDDVTVASAGVQTYSITTSSNPVSGGSTSGGGSYNIGQLVTVVATPTASWNFLNWTENGTEVSTSASYSFNASANRNLVANFSMNQITVGTSSNPPAGGTTSGGGTFTVGSQVTVSASPSLGYNFLNWTNAGNVVSTQPVYTFTANGTVNLVANFEVQQFSVSTSSNPVGGGTTSGGGTYSYNASVTVNASAASGYLFTGWYENGILVSVNSSYNFNVTANHALVAYFEEQVQTYNISVSASPAMGGAVSGGGNMTAGSQATVVASPYSGWVFTNWTEAGNIVSTSASYTFTVTANRSLTANFVQSLSIIASANPANAGWVTGAGNYTPSAMVNLHAFASEGYKFYNWTENGHVVSTEALYSFVASVNRDLVANFLSTVDISAAETGIIKLYPNPTESFVYIESDNMSIKQVIVSDPMGRMLFQIFPDGTEKRIAIDLSGLKTGMYGLKIISTDESVINRKVVLN